MKRYKEKKKNKTDKPTLLSFNHDLSAIIKKIKEKEKKDRENKLDRPPKKNTFHTHP